MNVQHWKPKTAYLTYFVVLSHLGNIFSTFSEWFLKKYNKMNIFNKKHIFDFVIIKEIEFFVLGLYLIFT